MIGYQLATKVQMTQMPELVAAMHSLVGLAAVFVGFIAHFEIGNAAAGGDLGTFATMIAIPVMQLILFGFAINSDPKHLPAAILDNDMSAFSRLFVTSLKATDYFDIRYNLSSPEQIDPLILSGRINFAVEIPQDFAQKLARGENPAILVVADAADPNAVNGAQMALTGMAAQVFNDGVGRLGKFPAEPHEAADPGQ